MKTILLTMIAVLTAAMGFAQGAKAPKAAQNDFNTRFPHAAHARWEKEGNHFEAEFRENGREVAVVYDAVGRYVMTEREIAVSDLPASVRGSVDAAMPGAEVLEAERQDKADGSTGYQAEVRHKGKIKEVTFDAEGNVLGEELEGDDAGEDGSDGSDGSDEDGERPFDPNDR